MNEVVSPHNNITQNIIFSKKNIQSRIDNVIHLITPQGKLLDQNTNISVKSKNITLKILKRNEIGIVDVGNHKLFVLCIDIAESNITIKNNLFKIFESLKQILHKTNNNFLSISKDIEISNVSWIEIENILLKTFKDTEIKIIVCLNYIKYVTLQDRDKIFDLYHSSLIGGHPSVNRTYNRIKEKYY